MCGDSIRRTFIFDGPVWGDKRRRRLARPGTIGRSHLTKLGNCMRIIGWPEEPDVDGGILPVTIVDVDFHGTPEELRLIGEFLLSAAGKLEIAQANNSELHVGVDLGNSNPSAEVGVSVNVVRHLDDW